MAVQELAVIDDAAAAIVALDPTRARILAALATPGSASSLAKRLDLPRQRVNYHLRALEGHGLVELIEERPRRGLMERLVQASAAAYVVSPAAMGDAAVRPDLPVDKLSARYLVAVAARAVRETADLLRRAEAAGRTLPTLTIDADIRFASAADRAAFAGELGDAVTALVARYHDEHATGGRWHRLSVLAHPRPAKETTHD